MKKFLSLLGAITISASSAATVISCSTQSDYDKDIDNDNNSSSIDLNSRNLIEKSALAKMQSIILDDVYKLNNNVIQGITLDQKVSNDDNYKISKYYNSLFNDSTATKASSSLKLNGTLGNEGGIFENVIDLINSKINDLTSGIGNSTIQNILNDVINGFFGGNKAEVVNKITSILKQLPQIIQTLNATTIATGIPVGIDMIPDFNFIQKGLLKGIQEVINSLINKISTNKFDNILKYFNMKEFADYNSTDMQKMIFTDIVNIIGGGMSSNNFEYLKIQKNEADVIGKKIKSIIDNKKDDSNNKQSEKKISNELIHSAINLLMTITHLLSIYEVDNNYQPNDQYHLFSNELNNNEYIKQINETKKMSDSKWWYNGNLKINLVGMISQFDYYFGHIEKTDESFNRFARFLNIIFNSPDSKNLFITNIIVNLIMSYMPQQFLSTYIDISKLMPIIINSVLSTILNGNAKLSSKIKFYLNPIKKYMMENNLNDKVWIISLIQNLIKNEIFDTNTLKYLYMDGSINNLIKESLKDEQNKDAKNLINTINNLENKLEMNEFNVVSFANIKLSKRLNLAGVKGYSDKDLKDNHGLNPNYAYYYTNKSITELVNELSKTFNLNGDETYKELEPYYLDIPLFKNVIDKLIGKQGILKEIINDLSDKNKLYELIGYKVDDLDKIKTDSFLGQLLLLMLPKIDAKNKEYISIENDVDKQNFDNFLIFMGALSNFINNIMKPTDYTEWVKKAIDPKNAAFKILDEQTRIYYFDKTKKIIKSEELIIEFDKNVIEAINNASTTKTLDKLQYRIRFSKDKKNNKFNFQYIEKVN